MAYYATVPARLCGGMDTDPDTVSRRATAAALAEKVKKTYTVSDIDTAAVIYNTVRSISDPNDLMEYFLGAVYAAGIETGKRRERERQRKVRERARRGSK